MNETNVVLYRERDSEEIIPCRENSTFDRFHATAKGYDKRVIDGGAPEIWTAIAAMMPDDNQSLLQVMWDILERNLA